MRISKRDFLKILGSGSAAATAVALTPKHLEPLQEPRIEPLPNVSMRPQLPVGEVFDIVDAILYDRVQFQPSYQMPLNIHLFSSPVGTLCPYSGGRAKGLEHTNMNQCGQLPAPEMFWLKRIHVLVSPETTPQDLELIDRYAWRFGIGQKRYAEGPVFMDRQKGTLKNLFKGKIAATRSSLELSSTGGLFIPQQMYFFSDLVSSVGGTVSPDGSGIDFLMALEGVMARPVQ